MERTRFALSTNQALEKPRRQPQHTEATRQKQEPPWPEADRATARCRIRSKDTVMEAVLAARTRLVAAASAGGGETHCVECGEAIPEKRRMAMARARTCVACQSGRDARTPLVGINRRGSKDS